eukprot:scaffold172_cov355-Prasinococcus_capsulatus_cf.AAC.3
MVSTCAFTGTGLSTCEENPEVVGGTLVRWYETTADNAAAAAMTDVPTAEASMRYHLPLLVLTSALAMTGENRSSAEPVVSLGVAEVATDLGDREGSGAGASGRRSRIPKGLESDEPGPGISLLEVIREAWGRLRHRVPQPTRCMAASGLPGAIAATPPAAICERLPLACRGQPSKGGVLTVWVAYAPRSGVGRRGARRPKYDDKSGAVGVTACVAGPMRHGDRVALASPGVPRGPGPGGPGPLEIP